MPKGFRDKYFKIDLDDSAFKPCGNSSLEKVFFNSRVTRLDPDVACRRLPYLSVNT